MDYLRPNSPLPSQTLASEPPPPCPPSSQPIETLAPLDRSRPALQGFTSGDAGSNSDSQRLNPLAGEDNNVDGTISRSGTDRDGSAGDEDTSRRRRRSRWDPPADGEEAGTGTRKRKSRWADDEPKLAFQLPDFMKDFTGGMSMDPEIQVLNSRLLEISRILQSGLLLDDRPDGARSPSPEPVYDNMGVRINTREYRARERLNRERQEIISQIIKRNPAFKPPADYRPPKLSKKLYAPVKQYPGYNFIGLIIGPRGNTQKRMEKETGAKIVIRGKGASKEGKLGQKHNMKYDPAEDEDLHVLVEASTQEALDAAAGMVQKLLQPVDEELNEHKRQQLRELAALNGTIREDEYCKLCGELGHKRFACPSQASTFKSDVLCKICGDGGHPTIDCPVRGTVGKKMDDEYQSFLAELGGTGPESLKNQSPATLSIMGSNGSGSNPPWANGVSSGGTGNTFHPGLGSNLAKPGKEIDHTNLYIGYLPPTFEDNALISMFAPYGDIVMAKVIKDRVTGLNKGYGFVKYADADQANQAIASMNGHRLEGRMIAVRVAGMPPQPVLPPGPPAPPFPAPNQGVGYYPSQQISSGGQLGDIRAGNYIGAPVPWGPPAPPPPYASYAPHFAPQNYYTPGQGQPMPPGQGQPLPPYSFAYSSQPQSAISGDPSQSMPSSDGQNYVPAVQPQINASSGSEANHIYGNSVTVNPQDSQSTYQPSSSGYPYFSMAPPPPDPPVGPQNLEGQSWATDPIPSSSFAAQNQQIQYGSDPEYEKFMAEMK